MKSSKAMKAESGFFLIIFLFTLGCFGLFSLLNSDASNSNSTHEGSFQIPNRAFPKTQTASSYQFQSVEGLKFKNLEIILLKGATSKGPTYLTLQEGLESGLVKVNETGEVGELSIDNLSKKYLFIHAGDIVKGGKQDRTLASDLIIPPGARKEPITSFCVEQGRWTKRGAESEGKFNKNSYILPNSKLKVAARYHRNQSRVWQEVEDVQSDMEEQVEERGGREAYGVVRDQVSKSSLQLSMESPAAKNMEKEYMEAFAALKTKTCNGLVYAINGKIAGIDLYNQEALFEDLWKKLLRSMIIEAISSDEGESFVSIDRKSLKEFIRQINYSQAPRIERVNRFTEIHTRTSPGMDLYDFTSYDLGKNRNWAHMSIVALAQGESLEKDEFESDQMIRRR